MSKSENTEVITTYDFRSNFLWFCESIIKEEFDMTNNNKKIVLSVPEPCSEDWNAMPEKEQGHYCSVCDKTLVNFADMSDEEITKTIEAKKSKGEKVCGHFRNDQLNRPLQNVLQYSRQYITLPVIASGAMLLSSMKIEEAMEQRYTHTTGVLVPRETNYGMNVLKGKVIDIDGQPVRYASIQAFDNKSIKPVYTDENGEFTLLTKENDNLILYASYRNKSSETVLIPSLSHAPYITFTLDQIGMESFLEGDVTVGIPCVEVSGNEAVDIVNTNISSLDDIVSGLLTDEYGNPIADATISVEGIHNSVISNQDGTFALPPLPEGDYIITIRHRDFKKKEVFRNVPSEYKRISVVLEHN